MKKTNMILLISALAAMMLVSACSTNGGAGNVVAGGETGLQAAPDFNLQTSDGRQVSLAANDNADKPTVVYFMASTCSTCAKNWKNIDEVYPEYQDSVDLIAVSVDPTDSAEVLTKLASDKGFTFDTVPGNPELAVKYGVTKQTAKFAIDKDGNIISRHDGLLTADEWKELFESVL